MAKAKTSNNEPEKKGNVKITMIADATISLPGGESKEFFKGEKTYCTELEFKSLSQSALKGHLDNKAIMKSMRNTNFGNAKE